jgi:hypothetical protein
MFFVHGVGEDCDKFGNILGILVSTLIVVIVVILGTTLSYCE